MSNGIFGKYVFILSLLTSRNHAPSPENIKSIEKNEKDCVMVVVACSATDCEMTLSDFRNGFSATNCL